MEKFSNVYSEMKTDIDIDWTSNTILKEYELELSKFSINK